MTQRIISHPSMPDAHPLDTKRSCPPVGDADAARGEGGVDVLARRAIENGHHRQCGQSDSLNGNLGQASQYDIENRPNNYWYSAANQRLLSKTTTPVLWFHGLDEELLGQFELRSDNGDPAKQYPVLKDGTERIYAGGRLLMMGWQSVSTDRLGSVVRHGTANLRYYPYGEEMGGATTQNRAKFATYTRDPDYAWNRQYGTITGRFTTPDPYRASGGPADPASWNRYSYVQNDPVNYYDRPGLLMQNPGYCPPDKTYQECVDDGTFPEIGGGGGGGGGFFIQSAPMPAEWIRAPLPPWMKVVVIAGAIIYYGVQVWTRDEGTPRTNTAQDRQAEQAKREYVRQCGDPSERGSEDWERELHDALHSLEPAERTFEGMIELLKDMFGCPQREAETGGGRGGNTGGNRGRSPGGARRQLVNESGSTPVQWSAPLRPLATALPSPRADGNGGVTRIAL